MILSKIFTAIFALLFVPQFHCRILKNNYDMNFIAEYFSMRNIQRIVLFSNWSIQESIDAIKYFSENNMRISLLDMKNKMTQKEAHSIFQPRTGIFYDFCHHDSRTSFLQKCTFFNESYIWLMFDCNNFNKSIEYIQTLQLLITTDMIVADNLQNDLMMDLYDVYNSGYDRDGIFNVTFVTTISNNLKNDEQLLKFLIKPKVLKRGQLEGLIMRTVTLTENNKNNIDTHTYLTDEINKHTDSIFRMNYQMILILQRLYNFTIKFVIANNWSDKDSNGAYKSGNLLGILANGKADIMAGSLQLVHDRLLISEVLYSTYPFRCGFIFRYQGDFGENKSSFLTPFSKIVWFCFLTIVIIVILVLNCILECESKYVAGINSTVSKFSDSFISIIGACCQMGAEVSPIASSSRIVYFIFFFSSLIIYNFYTSSIVSSLLNYGSETFNIVDLANSPLKCGSLDVGYVHNLLFDTPVYPNMDYFNKRKKTKNFYFTIKEGISLVKKGGFAYHAEYNNFYRLIENTFEATEICELKEIGTIPYSKLAILGMKYSQYTELFKVGLTKASETGHLKKLLLKWVARKPECQASKSFTEVGINQITPSHFVLYMGFTLSVLILIIEILLSRLSIQRLFEYIFQNNKIAHSFNSIKQKI